MKTTTYPKNIPYRRMLVAYALWFITGVALHYIILVYSADLDPVTAMKDACLTNGLLALGAYGTINILRFYQPRQSLRLAYSVGLAVGSVYAMAWLSEYLISDEESYENFLHHTFLLRCVVGWLMISLVSSTAWLWTHLNEQQELEARTNENERLAKEAELATLRQQLQPHFLFNSLNSISALVVTKPEQARTMIQQLSDFLRGTLKKDEQQLVTFSEELEHLRLYLEIEKVRFGHRLKTEIVHDDGSLKMKLPSLLLQPIVENAIKFGLYDTTGEIVIALHAKANGQYLEVKVDNPFDASTSAPRQGTGFGLTSVQRRLVLLYARHDLLSTSQDNNIFTTNIKIPQLS